MMVFLATISCHENPLILITVNPFVVNSFMDDPYQEADLGVLRKLLFKKMTLSASYMQTTAFLINIDCLDCKIQWEHV